MIIHDVIQGSDSWHAIRCGIPTTSRFKDILTSGGKTGKPKLSESSDGYMAELLVEWAFGMPIEQVNSREIGEDQERKPSIWMARGNEMEPHAVAAYEMANEVKTRAVGFVTTNDLRIGSSPDRLVGEHGAAEFKCPKAETHMGSMLEEWIPTIYKPQVQGQLWVCELDWDDWTTYFPGLPLLSVRAERDEDYISAQKDAVDEFCDRLEAAKERLIRRYGDWRIPRKKVVAPDPMEIGEEEETILAIIAGKL